MKIILDKNKYNEIWKILNNKFSFNPSIDINVAPFEFNIDYVCYKLNSVWTDNQEKIVNDILKKISNEDIYALDWHHDCFEYNPNENIKAKYHYHDTDRDVEVYFPTYYPNGDYYFFISKNWEYGMLGHPWRKELYIFGKELMDEFSKAENELNITRQYKE